MSEARPSRVDRVKGAFGVFVKRPVHLRAFNLRRARIRTRPRFARAVSRADPHPCAGAGAPQNAIAERAAQVPNRGRRRTGPPSVPIQCYRVPSALGGPAGVRGHAPSRALVAAFARRPAADDGLSHAACSPASPMTNLAAGIFVTCSSRLAISGVGRLTPRRMRETCERETNGN